MAILIRQAAEIPKTQLDQLGPVKKPLSFPPAELTGVKYFVGRGGDRMMGVWECSPGCWQRTILEEEFAHFVAGSARFIPEDGEPIDIRAGDSIWFPRNSRGVWEITENVRKVYVILYPRGFRARARSAISAALAILRMSLSMRGRVPVKSAGPGFARTRGV